jgi:hypothetical protein
LLLTMSLCCYYWSTGWLLSDENLVPDVQ